MNDDEVNDVYEQELQENNAKKDALPPSQALPLFFALPPLPA